MTDKDAYLWMVGTRCAPELDAEFNRWYDEVHIPMLAREGHILSVNRYRLSSEVESDQAQYLAIYRFKDVGTFKSWLASDALSEARSEMKETWGGRDMEIRTRSFYEPVSQWSKSS